MSFPISTIQSDARLTEEVDTAELFKLAFRSYAGGVAVITADAGQGPAALTLTSLTSISVEPPLLAFSLSEFSSSAPVVLAAEHLVVHLLDSRHVDIAKLGATSGIDRFADTSKWHRLPTGEPIYRGVDTWLRCEIVDTISAGGSSIVVAKVVEASAETSDQIQPLVYSNRQWHELTETSRLNS